MAGRTPWRHVVERDPQDVAAPLQLLGPLLDELLETVGSFGLLRQQSIDSTLDQVKLRGLFVRAVSPLDPSGWVSVNLERDPSVPIPPVNPPKVHGPEPAQTASNPAPAVGQR